MLFQKEFEYNNESYNETMDILHRTVLRKWKISYAAGTLAFAAISLAVFIREDNLRGGIVLALLLLASLVIYLFRNADEKAFAEACEPGYYGQFFSLNRKLSLFDEHLSVYAKYSNPNIHFSEEEKKDKQMMEYFRETDEMMSLQDYPLKKLHCYESRGAFLIYRRRNDIQTITKSQLDESDIRTLHEYFSERLGRRFIKID